MVLYLGNPLLPINITASGAADSIKKQLAQKNWHAFEQSPLKLNLVPYFLFNYHYFTEAEKVPGHKIVKNSVDGILAIDGHDVQIREDLVELLKTNWRKSVVEVPKIDFDEKWCNIDKKEVFEVLKVKTAEHFEIPKENVVVSSPKKLFLPLYKTTITVKKTNYNLIVNAVDGNILGIDKIPVREKGYAELTQETINDLKQPRNWLKYSAEAIGLGVFAIVERGKGGPSAKENAPVKAKKGFDLSFLDSNWVLVLILLLGLALIYMGYYHIRPF